MTNLSVSACRDFFTPCPPPLHLGIGLCSLVVDRRLVLIHLALVAEGVRGEEKIATHAHEGGVEQG